MVDRAPIAVGFAARMWAILLVALWLTFPSASSAAALAQPATDAAQPASAPVSADELQRLVNSLQDDAQRARLVEELRGLIAAQRGVEANQSEASPSSVLALLSQRIEAISDEVLAAAAVVVDIPRLASWLEEQATDPVLRAFWLDVALKLVIIFGLALIAEWTMRRVLARPRRSLTGSRDQVLLRVLLTVVRAGLDALPILTFAGVAYVVLPFVGARFATARVATTLIGAYVTARIITAIARIVLL